MRRGHKVTRNLKKQIPPSSQVNFSSGVSDLTVSWPRTVAVLKDVLWKHVQVQWNDVLKVVMFNQDSRPFCWGYYYGLILCVLNLSVALIPIAMVSAPALQLALMGVVLWVRQTSLCLLWPWRLGWKSHHEPWESSEITSDVHWKSLKIIEIDQDSRPFMIEKATMNCRIAMLQFN